MLSFAVDWCMTRVLRLVTFANSEMHNTTNLLHVQNLLGSACSDVPGYANHRRDRFGRLKALSLANIANFASEVMRFAEYTVWALVSPGKIAKRVSILRFPVRRGRLSQFYDILHHLQSYSTLERLTFERCWMCHLLQLHPRRSRVYFPWTAYTSQTTMQLVRPGSSYLTSWDRVQGG